MKKVFSICTALFLLIALCNITAVADGTMSVSLSSETASIGDEVALTFSVSENPGVAVIKFSVAFNPEALEPLSAEMLDIFGEGMFITNLDEPGVDFSNYNNITFLWAQVSNCYDTGDMAVFKFRVKDTAYSNVTVKLKYAAKDIINENHEKLEIQTEDGMVEVLDADENAAASDDYDEFEIVDDQPVVDPSDPFENKYDFPGQNDSESHTSKDPNLPENNGEDENDNPDEPGTAGEITPGSTTPVDGNTTPVDGGNGSTTPDGGSKTPDGGSTTPDGGSTTPDGGSTTPNGGSTTPGGSGGNTGNTGNNQTQNPGNDGTNQDAGTSNIDDGTNGSGNNQPDIVVSYTDISKHWAKNSIRAMSQNGIFKGYEDGTFRPNIGLSRQEMAVSVVRLLGLEGELGTVDMEKFTDDDEIADWAKDYVYLLVGKGIFKGYDDGSFGPRGIITREQLSLVLARSLKNPPETLSEIKFNDVHKISDWAKDAVAAMVTLRIVNGYEDQTFRPQNDVTRAETCTMMYKFLVNNR